MPIRLCSAAGGAGRWRLGGVQHMRCISFGSGQLPSSNYRTEMHDNISTEGLISDHSQLWHACTQQPRGSRAPAGRCPLRPPVPVRACRRGSSSRHAHKYNNEGHNHKGHQAAGHWVCSRSGRPRLPRLVCWVHRLPPLPDQAGQYHGQEHVDRIVSLVQRLL